MAMLYGVKIYLTVVANTILNNHLQFSIKFQNFRKKTHPFTKICQSSIFFLIIGITPLVTVTKNLLKQPLCMGAQII